MDNIRNHSQSEAGAFSRMKYWIPALLIAALISFFSTGYFTSERTGRFILPLLHWLFPFASHHALHLMHLLIRKLAHVTEFAALSITIFHGIRGPRHGWKPDWALLTLLIAIAYAGLDEWHQSFVPLRQASLRDVATDGVGALLAQAFVWAYAKWHRNSPELPRTSSERDGTRPFRE